MDTPSIDLGTFPVNAGQKFAFSFSVEGSSSDVASFTGMRFTGQIRRDARPIEALVVPAIEVGAPVINGDSLTVEVTFLVTAEQCALLPCSSKVFTAATRYAIDFEAAYSDDDTPSLRFYGAIEVYQGGTAPVQS